VGQAHIWREVVEVLPDLALVEVVELAPEQGLQVEEGVLAAPVEHQLALGGAHRPDQDGELGEQGLDQGLLHSPAAGAGGEAVIEHRLQGKALGELGEAQRRQARHLGRLKEAGRHHGDAGVEVGLAAGCAHVGVVGDRR
jgi:hypothetical protein